MQRDDQRPQRDEERLGGGRGRPRDVGRGREQDEEDEVRGRFSVRQGRDRVDGRFS